MDNLRDLFKFEFFYAPSEQFHQQIRAELDHYHEDWETLLERGAAGFGELLENMTPLVSHITLLTYAEAYSVVADMLAGMDASQSLDENSFVDDALKFGRQAYLQRRISSESSIGKLLFINGYKTLHSRQLTEGGDSAVHDRRLDMAHELRDLLRRIEVIHAIREARRGITQGDNND